VKTVGVLYFSDNELHCLDVAYGIASIKNNDCNVIIQQIQNDNFNKVINSIIIENPTIIVIFLSYGCFDLLKKSCFVIKDKKSEFNNYCLSFICFMLL
jgi:hypothetical protein